MENKKWMIYGANGYTGRLIVAEAVKRGLKPVLAGRSTEVVAIASKNELESKIFKLSSVEKVKSQIAGYDVIANCAGPFSATAEIMIQACLESKVHYIDITGEISVYDYANNQDDAALSSGIVLCPGVGSDVIPTDCLAAYLKEKCPDATHLTMAWLTKGSRPSKGTAKTAVEGLASGGKIREDGVIKKVPLAHKEREIDFGFGPINTMTIPWGDIFTAYHSTGIPNIEFYFARSHQSVNKLRRQRMFLGITKIGWVMKFIKNRIDKVWNPTSAEERAKAQSFFWGEVKNKKGKTVVGRFNSADGYNVTAWGTVEVAEYLLGDHTHKGYYTPSILMGKELIEKMPGFSGIKFETN